MSHFSLNLPSSDTLWYTPIPMEQQQQQQSNHTHQKSLPFFYHSSLSLSSSHDVESDNSSSNNNNTTPITTNVVDRSETTSSTSSFDREYMFEKPLTPSDVGKLNRLVIPKQHAEKYFPLASATSDSSTAVVGADKSGAGGGGGVLLGFEDESGKCWKFRYSYWNSSQSYVLTKGWSRYVKEKKLDAGDVVLFDRHRFESDRFFIGWRRRGSPPVHNPGPAGPVQFNNNNNNNNHQNYGVAQSQGLNGGPHHHQISSFPSYRPDCLHAGTEVRQKGRKSGGGNSKRVRLFGVNLECQIEEEEEDIEEPQTSDGSSLSSQGQGQAGSSSGFGVGPAAYNYFDYVGYPPNYNYSNHMDMNFPQDVNQMRNRLR